MLPVPFISLIVKQFKFYVSCVSLPQVQPRLVARNLVNSLVPMNVKEKKKPNYASLTRKLVSQN